MEKNKEVASKLLKEKKEKEEAIEKLRKIEEEKKLIEDRKKEELLKLKQNFDKEYNEKQKEAQERYERIQEKMREKIQENLKVEEEEIDNKIVKIKRLTFDDFENEINMKNKSYNIDLSIKIDNGIKTNIEGETNLSLLKMKWKEILLENKLYQEKDIDIMYQIPEIRELLDMTFEGSLKNILKVKWEQIAEKEKNRQKKDYVLIQIKINILL